MLYANSTIPLYRQLYRHFRNAIDEGELRVGEQLPSERRIAAEYGISRITTRKALTLLRQEGYVRAIQGKGAFVSQGATHTHHRVTVKSFSEIIRSMGMTPSSKTLSCGIVPVRGEVAMGLGLQEYEKVIKIRRLRLADGVPMALDTTHLSYPLCHPVLHANLDKNSLYWTLQEMAGIELSHADQSFQFILMSDGDLKLLRLEPPAAVLQLKRQTYDLKGHIVEYSVVIYQRDLGDLEIFAGTCAT